jgi:hypothetical protein
MTHFAIKGCETRILVWLFWVLALLVFIHMTAGPGYQADSPTPLLGVVTHDPKAGPLFPWQARYRWKKYALAKYRTWRRAYRRAKRAALLARLALSGVMTMAQVVE